MEVENDLFQFLGEDDFIVDDENQPVRERSRKKGGKVQDRYCYNV
jgi:hypothetical protein